MIKFVVSICRQIRHETEFDRIGRLQNERMRSIANSVVKDEIFSIGSIATSTKRNKSDIFMVSFGTESQNLVKQNVKI